MTESMSVYVLARKRERGEEREGGRERCIHVYVHVYMCMHAYITLSARGLSSYLHMRAHAGSERDRERHTDTDYLPGGAAEGSVLLGRHM